MSAQSNVERELRDDAARFAAAVTQETFRTSGRRQLPLIRAVLRLQDAGVAVVPPGGGPLPPTVLGELPDTVGVSPAEAADLEPGETLSGSSGGVAWAVGAADAEGTRVIVGVSREVDFELGPAIRYFLVASAVVLVLSALGARMLADRMTEPISEAERVSRRLAAGDLTARIPDPATDDEVADLTRSINAMAEALERARGLERQFLLSVSHDLRTPLTSIRGYAEAIADGTADEPHAAADVILRESRRLERLVSDLLDLAKLDAKRFSLDRRSLDVVEELGDVVAGFTPDARSAGITIRLSTTESVPVVADPDRLAQVVANLIENATKFARSQIEVSATTDGTTTSVVVDDDGPGISPIDLPHVFERLYVTSARPVRKEVGSGLGLAICRELVQAMDGTIEATERPGGGARFVVQLPSVPDPT